MNKEFKSLIGKTVYLMPMGNLASRRRGNKEPIKAVITKVGRVNVTFLIDGYSTPDSWRMDGLGGLGIESEHNSCYVVYKSKRDYEEVILASNIAKRLPRYSAEWMLLGYKKLSAIQEIILGNKKEGEK